MLLLPFVPDAALVVDGRADEAAWSSAAELPDGVPFWPNDTVEPVGSLRARVLSDARNLYVHLSVTDPEPALVRAGLGRRDSRYADDYVGIQLDPGLTGRRSYRFYSNALGVQTDGVHLLGEASYQEDNSWDALWTSVGRRTDTGWEVEMAIPWSSLQVSRDAGELGLVVVRQVARKSHTYAWPQVEPNTDALLSQATLRGPSGLPTRLGLEIMPEVTGGWSDPPAETGRLGLFGVSPGLTLRYSPSSAFAASATANPDFSQIESDSSRIEVNQRYAQTYDEKRPFFLEGQEAFEHPFSDLYYSRSVNAPLYGARLFGQAGNVSVSGLHALDMLPPPSVNEGGGWTEGQLSGHSALASVVRAQYATDNGSAAGVFLSDRTVLDTALSNRVAAIDGTLRVGRNFHLEGAALGSATTFAEGEAERFSPAGRVAGGWSSDTFFAFAKAFVIGEDFRQENGFVTQSDIAGGSAEAHYELHPGGAVPMLSLEPTDGWAYFDLDGTPRERAWDPSVWAQFDNGTFLKLDGRVAGEAFAGAWIDYARAELYAFSTVGDWFRLDGGIIGGTTPYYDPVDPRVGVVQGGELGIQLQPTASVLLELSPGLSRMTELTGEELFVAWTGRARLEVFVDRRAWLRFVADTQGDDQGLSEWRLEPLLAYEWTPGRALYLGGAYGEADATAYWQVFAKASWRFLL